MNGPLASTSEFLRLTLSLHIHSTGMLSGDLSASELKKLQRKERKAQLKAQAKAQEERKGKD